MWREVSWSPPSPDGEIEFLTPLAIQGLTIGGLFLRGSCLERFPDQEIMLQLEVGSPGVRTRHALIRLEWRPLREPHKNPRLAAADQSKPGYSTVPREVWGTHVHPFDMNWVPQNDAMRSGNLLYAIEIRPDFQDYQSLLDHAKFLFKINVLERIERPLWSERLL